MLVTCPECAYSRDIPADKIPALAEVATCPKCGHKFRFRTLPEDMRQAPAEPAAAESAPIRPEAQGDGPGPRDQASEGPEAAAGTAPGEEPAEGAPGREGFAAAEAIEEVPFERLDVHGFFPGLILTIRRAMLSPRRFFETMPLKGIVLPLVFSLLLSEFQFLVQMLWHLTGLGVSEHTAEGREAIFSLGIAGVGSLTALLLYPLLLTAFLFGASAIYHGLLVLLRAATKGFEGTFRVVAYSSAPFVLAVVPVLGPLVAAGWSIVVTVIGWKCLHRTTYPKVLVAFGVPFALFLLVLFMAIKGAEPTL